MDVVATAPGRDIPLGDVANALGVLQGHSWYERDVAQRGTAKTRDNGAPGGCSPPCLQFEIVQVQLRDGVVLFQVVGGTSRSSSIGSWRTMLSKK